MSRAVSPVTCATRIPYPRMLRHTNDTHIHMGIHMSSIIGTLAAAFVFEKLNHIESSKNSYFDINIYINLYIWNVSILMKSFD